MNEAHRAAEIGTAAYAAGKAGGTVAAKHTFMVAGAGVTLAAIVVMSMTMPRSKCEFFVALISTVVSSLSGGAWMIQEWALLGSVVGAMSEIELWLALAKLGGVFFVCGLPGWILVRAAFVWSEARKNKGIDVFIRDIKRVWK
jgi:hypothetical protein